MLDVIKTTLASDSIVVVTLIISVTLILVIMALLVTLAPNGQRLADLIEKIVDIVVRTGILGCWEIVFRAITAAVSKVYADFSLEKVVLVIFLAVFLKSVPWVLDAVMSLLTWPPNTLVALFAMETFVRK